MATLTLYSLTDYNEGKLIPKTFDLDVYDNQADFHYDVGIWLEELTEELGGLREEWIVCDYDDIPRQYVGTYDLASAYWEYADAVKQSCLDPEVFEAAANCDIPPSEVEERYTGEYDSWKDWAEQFAEDTGMLSEVPENLQYYFDFEAYGRDARLGGDMCEDSGHFFHCC